VPKHRLFIRRFLNLPSHHRGAYVLVEVADTTGRLGSYVEPEVVLEISDCSRRVDLDFPLFDARSRRNSLRKARILRDAAARFVDALEAEAELAASREKENLAARRDRLGETSGLTDWMVHVETTGPVEGFGEDHVDDLMDALRPHSGVMSWTREGRVTATITIWAACRRDALLLGPEVLRTALAAVGLAHSGRVTAEVELG
jgi:hypothetical protein